MVQTAAAGLCLISYSYKHVYCHLFLVDIVFVDFSLSHTDSVSLPVLQLLHSQPSTGHQGPCLSRTAKPRWGSLPLGADPHTHLAPYIHSLVSCIYHILPPFFPFDLPCCFPSVQHVLWWWTGWVFSPQSLCRFSSCDFSLWQGRSCYKALILCLFTALFHFAILCDARRMSPCIVSFDLLLLVLSVATMILPLLQTDNDDDDCCAIHSLSSVYGWLIPWITML